MSQKLTKVEYDKIKEEISYRQTVVTPKCIAEVQRTRALGDLSENDEYRSAKRELNRNYSRLRYLSALIDNSEIVEYVSSDDEIGMFDKVTVYFEDDDAEETYTIVTALRKDALENRISDKSPLGAALLGHKTGDRILVNVNENFSYYATVRSIEKGHDDADLQINSY